MVTWIIILALIWPLFLLLRVLLTAKALMGFEFRRARVAAHSPAGISPHIREAAQPWITQLEQGGFKLLGGWVLGTAADPALDEEAVVLAHGDQPVRAVILPREESALNGECWLSLRTTLKDGTEIVTNTHSPEVFLPVSSGILVEVCPTTLASEAFQRHLARVAEAQVPVWHCTGVASSAIREQHIRDAMLGAAVAQGLLAEHRDGGFSYTPKSGFQQALAIIRIAKKNKQNAKAGRIPTAKPLSAESLLSFDLHHYRQMVAFTRGRLSLRTKAIISAVSFLIFAGVLAWQYSLVVAVTLIVALVIHECGHLLGMRWFGYRDTQLLFVPFFGGAAIGHDEKVLHPWQHIVIILLGPLPGIFLGLALLAYSGGGGAPAWVGQAALTMLVLNAFNLLPIIPLDGGQIVDFAVASRFPRARVLFLAVSAGGMILVGLGLGGAKLLFGVGIATLIRLPVEWRLAGVRREVREEFPEGGEEEPIVRRLLESMREPEWAKTPVSQRLKLVRGLQLVMRMARPGFGTMCFALAGFTAPLWLGTPLAVWAVIRQSEAQVRQAEARAEAAGVKATRPPTTTTPAGLAPEDNAAVDYAKAEALTERRRGKGDEDAGEGPEEEVVTLLRAAAHKKAFVPVANAAAIGRKAALLENWSRGRLVDQLTVAAGERIRYQEPAEAIFIAADALRLLRLMQATPGAIAWDSYHYTVGTCWNTIEEALATGIRPSAGVIAELRELSAEQPVIDFAATAIPQGMLGQSRLGEDSGDSGELGGSYRFLMLLQRVNPTWTRYRVEGIDQAVVAQTLLQAIQHGTWPKPNLDAEAPKQAMIKVAQLGDLLARQRQLRTALRMIESHETGKKDVSLDQLGAGPTELLHPFTHEKVRLVRRGALDVLTFSAGTARLWAVAEGSEAAGLLWRVPVELH